MQPEPGSQTQTIVTVTKAGEAAFEAAAAGVAQVMPDRRASNDYHHDHYPHGHPCRVNEGKRECTPTTMARLIAEIVVGKALESLFPASTMSRSRRWQMIGNAGRVG